MDSRVTAIRETEATAAQVENTRAVITVRFVSEQPNTLRDAQRAALSAARKARSRKSPIYGPSPAIPNRPIPTGYWSKPILENHHRVAYRSVGARCAKNGMALVRFYLIVLLALFGVAPASAADAPDLAKGCSRSRNSSSAMSNWRGTISSLSTPRTTTARHGISPERITCRGIREFFSRIPCSSLSIITACRVEDYPIADMKALAAPGGKGGAKASKLLVTDALLHLAHALHGDTVDLDQLYPGWDFHRADIDIPNKSSWLTINGNTLDTFIASLAPEESSLCAIGAGVKKLSRHSLARRLADRRSGPYPAAEG